MMTAGLRKIALAAHITFSVGWIGAVLVFLTLVAAAITTQDTQTLFAAWIAMGFAGSFVLVPLSLASMLTGLIMSLGTKWGLFQHYWVLISFALTTLAAGILFGNMQTVNYYAGTAAQMDRADVVVLRAALQSELLHAGIGLLVLLVIQVLNVFKPRGLTPYGWRRQREQRTMRQPIDVET